jgi:hypothetical protein
MELTRRHWFLLVDDADGLVGEFDRPMPIRLEVHADIEVARSRVVEVLDARLGADDLQLQDVAGVLGRRAVGVGGLHEANVEFLLETRAAGEVDDEDRGEGGDAVAVEEVEDLLLVGVVVDDAVGVAVEGAAAFVGVGIGLGGSALLGFDVIGAALNGFSSYQCSHRLTYLEVESLWSDGVVVDNLDVDTAVITPRGKILDQFLKCWTADSIGTVDSDSPRDLATNHDDSESLGHLLVVALFGRHAILVVSTGSVEAASDIVQLRCCEESIVR